MATGPSLSDIVSIAVAGFVQPYRISTDTERHGTYSLELVNASGTNGSALGMALGPHFVLTPNGRLDGDPTVPEGNGPGILVPIGSGVVVYFKRTPASKS